MNGPDQGRFSCDGEPHGFCDAHKGGGVTRKGAGVSHPSFPLSLSFFGSYPPYSSPLCAVPEKSGETIATPLETGAPCGLG